MPDEESMTVVIWWVKIVDVHEGYECSVTCDRRQARSKVFSGLKLLE